jgi:hypothetical protein
VSCLMVYVARGLDLTGGGFGALRDLAWAPVYAAWKLTLAFRASPASRGQWVRTTRARDISA